jgi:glycosyltransferase involved in cell wall biosynthesis
MPTTNVLMITYNRAEAVRRSLPRLLETCPDDCSVWLWHNGTDEETLSVVQQYSADPRVERFHHSPENQKLRAPTNWLWTESSATYVSKVDDDCLVSPGWLQTLRIAHEDYAGFGVIGSWRHYPDEFVPDLANRKIRTFPGGHRVMQNHWVQGSGYLMKRQDVETIGVLEPNQSFTGWCIQLARRGRTNGFYYPFIFEDHMDDPRSENTLLRTDADLLNNLPLTARRNSVRSLAEWEQRNRQAARLLQGASLDMRHYTGWRPIARRARRRVAGMVTGRKRAW